jgi:hypothetical protein
MLELPNEIYEESLFVSAEAVIASADTMTLILKPIIKKLNKPVYILEHITIQ